MEGVIAARTPLLQVVLETVQIAASNKFKGSEYLNPAHQSHLIITEMELHYTTHTKSCCSVMFKYSDNPLAIS